MIIFVGYGATNGMHMSFYGSILLSRSDTLLPLLPAAQRLGYRHNGLRDLGGGWQVMQIGGWNDPPDMVAGVAEVSNTWNAPVLAAYVADVCVQVHTGMPGAPVTSVHLPDPQLTSDCGMLHRPEFTDGCTHTQAQQQIEHWARQARLNASSSRLKRVIEHEYTEDGEYLPCYEQVYELVHALGFDEFPAEVPTLLDPEREPFWRVSGHVGGIAMQARSLAVRRQDRPGSVEPEALWESAAIRLQLDLHAAKYDSSASLEELIRRCQVVLDDHRSATADDDAPPPEIVIGGRAVTNPDHLARVMTQMREEGRLITNHTWPDRLAGRGRWPQQ